MIWRELKGEIKRVRKTRKTKELKRKREKESESRGKRRNGELRRKEKMFYLTTRSTHFIYGYMAL